MRGLTTAPLWPGGPSSLAGGSRGSCPSPQKPLYDRFESWAVVARVSLGEPRLLLPGEYFGSFLFDFGQNCGNLPRPNGGVGCGLRNG